MAGSQHVVCLAAEDKCRLTLVQLWKEAVPWRSQTGLWVLNSAFPWLENTNVNLKFIVWACPGFGTRAPSFALSFEKGSLTAERSVEPKSVVMVLQWDLFSCRDEPNYFMGKELWRSSHTRQHERKPWPRLTGKCLPDVEMHRIISTLARSTL